MDDDGERIAYTALEEDTPVLTRDGQRIGAVKRVLADFEDDIFDGLLLDTPDGDRFVDADHIADIYERAVVLSISDAEASHLPEPEPAAAVVEVDPEDTVKRTAAERIGQEIRDVWNRISGRY
ncbi:MAG: PRC-barrel domain-containing protein [Thermoleophilaceae bacterium]|jgi:Mrp family chromosome partitioning ATPase